MFHFMKMLLIIILLEVKLIISFVILVIKLCIIDIHSLILYFYLLFTTCQIRRLAYHWILNGQVHICLQVVAYITMKWNELNSRILLFVL